MYRDGILTFKYFKQSRPIEEIGDGRYVAFYNAIKHASKRHYERIMILWDNVEFYSDVKEVTANFARINLGGDCNCIMETDVINTFAKYMGKIRKGWYEKLWAKVCKQYVLIEQPICYHNAHHAHVNRSKRVIVTLTTYTKRIQNVHLIIDDILRNTVQPYKIILNLSKQEFHGDLKFLPDILRKYISDGKVELLWSSGDIK